MVLLIKVPQLGASCPASAFRHQGQAGHGLVRHCPAMYFKQANNSFYLNTVAEHKAIKET
jgi:hypothetical protein